MGGVPERSSLHGQRRSTLRCWRLTPTLPHVRQELPSQAMMPTSQDRTNFPEDFLDAMDRHWQDAELLRREERLANADHLYGLSVECGLKALMKKLGMEMRGNRPENSNDRKHINNGLLDRYESYCCGHDGPRFSLPWQSDNSPFANWDISDRYAKRSDFTEERLEKHQSGAKDVKQLVARLKTEGLFS